MALFIPGQKIHPCVGNWDLVIPWWNWCSWCSVLSLSEGGMMRASPHRTRPSSTVRVSHNVASKDIRGARNHLYVIWANWWWWCQQECASLESLMKVCWNASFCSGDRWAWWKAMSSGMSGPGHGLKQERACLAGPFPYQVSNRWCSHSPRGAVACAAAGLVCLPGSSGRWIPGACGLIQW